jgi:hypothetical protein
VAVLAPPVSAQSFGDGTASSLRLSGKEREALRLLVDERQRVKLKMKLERYEPPTKRKARVS